MSLGKYELQGLRPHTVGRYTVSSEAMRQENKEKKLQDQNLITTPSLGSTPRKMDWPLMATWLGLNMTTFFGLLEPKDGESIHP